MKQILNKIALCFCTFSICFVVTFELSAQTSATNLVLNTPINSEIIDGKAEHFTVQLLADQTARIEVEQKGIDVSLAAYNSKGEKFLEFGSPSGRLGSELFLLTATETGEYKVEVKPAFQHYKAGKFTIVLTDIRATTPDDRLNNEATKRILELEIKVTGGFKKATIAERRELIRNYRELIKFARIKKDKIWEGLALIGLGLAYSSLGEYQNALDAQLQGRKVFQEAKSRRYEAVAIGNIGGVWLETRDYEKAVAYYEEALKIHRELKSKYSEATVLGNLGLLYLLTEQPNKAINYFQQALSYRVQTKSRIAEAVSLDRLGRAHVKIGEYQKGIEYLQKALKLNQELGNHFSIGASNLNLGRAFWEIGDTARAYENFSQANVLANEVGNRQLIEVSHYYLALVERSRGNLAKAIENVEKGLEVIEKIRSEFRTENARTTYFANVQDYYELYIDMLLERSEKNKNAEDISLAFEVSERSRSRSLIDLLQEARVNFRQGVDVQLLEKEKDLIDSLNRKYRSRERLFGKTPKQEEIDKLTSEINILTTELESLDLKIKQENPRYANLTRAKILSTKEIQKLLDNETVLLEYKLGKERSFLWLVTKDSFKVHELPGRETIEKQARKFYELTIANNINETKQRQSLSKELSKTLMPEIASNIKGKRLAIVADGILQYLPFSALQDNESNYLVDENEIVILPSASVLAQLRENPNKTNLNSKTIAVFADPVFDKDDTRISQASNSKPTTRSADLQKVLRDFRLDEKLPRLLGSRQEARNISDLVSSNKISVKTDFEANLENVETANLADYQIVHFATHGLLSTSHPELSGLVFSLYDKKGQSQNGFLSLNDIYNLDLSSDMVVLSACQTALGKDVRGEGLIGISRGFLYAGSNRIVASLWKVDDAATAEFMKRFYRNHLEKRMPASKALQQTKIEMKKIRRYQSPYYWSAFTLLGEWQ